MVLPVWCVEGPDIAVAQDVTSNGREPGPPLEATHGLGGCGVPAVPVRSLLIIGSFEEEPRLSWTISIGTASLRGDVTVMCIGAIKRHLTPETGLIRGNPSAPLRAEEYRLLPRHTLEAGQESALHIVLRGGENPHVPTHHPDEVLLVFVARRDPRAVSVHLRGPVRHQLLHPALVAARVTRVGGKHEDQDALGFAIRKQPVHHAPVSLVGGGEVGRFAVDVTVVERAVPRGAVEPVEEG